MKLRFAVLLSGYCWAVFALGQDNFNKQQEELLKELEWSGSRRLCVGMSRLGTRLWCVMDEDALNYRHDAPRLLAIAGLEGRSTDWPGLVKAVQRAVARRQETGADYRLAVIPLANPDGYFTHVERANGSGGNPSAGYPPEGTAYNSTTNPEQAHVWRFIGWFAPDLVIEVQGEGAADWQHVLKSQSAANCWPEDSLAGSLKKHAPAGVGTVPSIRYVTWPNSPESDVSGRLRMEYIGMSQLAGNPFEKDSSLPRSAARQEIVRRLDRRPVDVLSELADHYGKEMKAVSYQPALAVLCRARLADLTANTGHLRQVEEVLQPYLSGARPALQGKFGGSQLAGHLVFADWGVRTADPRAIQLVKAAANYGFDDKGQPLEAMPFHVEMSDSIFMSCPILCSAGQLTQEMKYFDMAERHLTFMQGLCWREDGIYRNSPLSDAAWGRGNGFPALGLALSLAAIDAARQSGKFAANDLERLEQIHDRMQRDLTRHLGDLSKHQDVTGMWQQVIDEPGSYRELTATCMIGYAMVQGIRSGWLAEKDFGPQALAAWEAVKVRVGSEGVLFDVCTGTGKQKSLRDYLDRTAILGIDERGGAMAMMFASQMALWKP